MVLIRRCWTRKREDWKCLVWSSCEGVWVSLQNRVWKSGDNKSNWWREFSKILDINVTQKDIQRWSEIKSAKDLGQEGFSYRRIKRMIGKWLCIGRGQPWSCTLVVWNGFEKGCEINQMWGTFFHLNWWMWKNCTKETTRKGTKNTLRSCIEVNNKK